MTQCVILRGLNHEESSIQRAFTSVQDDRVLKKKAAFTLAEVLITLGIIGVVAALTLPGLIQSNNNRVVETKLKKFYSQINQAILLAEAEYGPKEYWYSVTNNVEIGADGNPIPGSSSGEKWFMKYIGAYMPVIKVEYDDLARPTYFFKDGTALKQMNGSMQTSQEMNFRDWLFYTSNPAKCEKLYGSEISSRGRCAWSFNFDPNTGGSNFKYLKGKGFEPYTYGWQGNMQSLIDACKGSKPEYCTAWIQRNGWEIPDDYPYKVSY